MLVVALLRSLSNLLLLMNLFKGAGYVFYVSTGSWAQACWMAMFTAIAVALGVRYKPYEATWANGFHVGSWLAVTMALLLTAALRLQNDPLVDPKLYLSPWASAPALCGMVLVLCAVGGPVAAVSVARRVLPDASGREGGGAPLVVTVANPADASLMPS